MKGTMDCHNLFMLQMARRIYIDGNTVKPADGEYEIQLMNNEIMLSVRHDSGAAVNMTLMGQSSKRQATEGILSRLPAAPRLAPVG